jgi:ABC-type transport system involved in cytochrome bd biosynthesis fused ATPase/permease subunit
VNLPVSSGLFLGLLAFLFLFMLSFLTESATKKQLVILIEALDETHVLAAMKSLPFKDESYFYEGEALTSERIEALHDLSVSLASSLQAYALVFGMLLLGALMSVISYLGALLFGIYLIFLLIVHYFESTLKNQEAIMMWQLDDYVNKRTSYIHTRSFSLRANDVPYEESYRQKQAFLYKRAQHEARLQAWLAVLYVASLIFLLVIESLHLLMLSMDQLLCLFVLITVLSSQCEKLRESTRFMNDERLYERYKKTLLEEPSKGVLLDRIASITLHNVSLSYGGDEVLAHIDGCLDHSCIVETKGATTLLKCLAGVKINVHGHIFYNDVSATALSKQSLYEHVYYVRPVFINGTVKDNLCCDDVEAMQNVLESLGAESLLIRLETPMSMSGAPLSSREQALLLIARALLAKQEVLLLDRLLDVFDDEEAKNIASLLFKRADRLILITTSKTFKNDLPYIIF